MDDDKPLSALQAMKPPPIDDEMTLAEFAAIKPKADRNGKSAGAKAKAGNGRGKAKAVAKGNAKIPQKKAAKVEERDSDDSSSSSSSSSSDDDDDGDEKPKAKAKAKATKSQRMAFLKREREGLADEDDEEEKKDNLVKKRDRTPKQQVVADLLCRWWYALPDWPPSDEEFYKVKLAEKKLRQVTIQEWEWVAEEDERGFKKVYQLAQFRGVFRNSSGDMIDLRPQETCPCFQNFMKKELSELYDLLAKAYEGQIKDLANSKYNETKLKKAVGATMRSSLVTSPTRQFQSGHEELEVLLTRTRAKCQEAKRISGTKRPRT